MFMVAASLGLGSVFLAIRFVWARFRCWGGLFIRIGPSTPVSPRSDSGAGVFALDLLRVNVPVLGGIKDDVPSWNPINSPSLVVRVSGLGIWAHQLMDGLLASIQGDLGPNGKILGRRVVCIPVLIH